MLKYLVKNEEVKWDQVWDGLCGLWVWEGINKHGTPFCYIRKEGGLFELWNTEPNFIRGKYPTLEGAQDRVLRIRWPWPGHYRGTRDASERTGLLEELRKTYREDEFIPPFDDFYMEPETELPF